MARPNIYTSIVVSTCEKCEPCSFWGKVEFSTYNSNCVQPGSLYKGQAKYNTDRQLHAKLNAEYNMQAGVVVEYYVTSYDRQADPLWGEDDNRKFLRKFDILGVFDELPQDQFTFDNFGIFSLDTWKFKVSKLHFECASKLAAEKTPSLANQGASEGYTSIAGKQFESHIPSINDYIRIKAGRGNQYYEVMYAEQLDSFLQGSYEWEITIKRMKDEQISVSDDFGQALNMNGIATYTDKRGDDRLSVVEANLANIEQFKHIATDDQYQPAMKEAWINSGGGDQGSFDKTGGWWDET